MIEIIDLHREKPSLPYDFIVDRTTALGNPLALCSEDRRDKVCNSYDAYLPQKIIEKDPAIIKELNILFFAYVHYEKLRLFCWCAPKRCHAETIRNILYNKYLEEKSKGHVK